MTAIANPSTWKWRHWAFVLVGFVWLALSFGVLGQTHESLDELARHPFAAQWFNDPVSGSREALIVLFVSGLMLPLASLIIAAIVIALARVGASPINRLIRSERIGTLMLLIALVGFVYTNSSQWWPVVRPYTAVLARAYVVAWNPGTHAVYVQAPAAATETSTTAHTPYAR